MENQKVDDKHDCGSGPTILESTGNGWRVVCCGCWKLGPIRKLGVDAIVAWKRKQ